MRVVYIYKQNATWSTQKVAAMLCNAKHMYMASRRQESHVVAEEFRCDHE